MLSKGSEVGVVNVGEWVMRLGSGITASGGITSGSRGQGAGTLDPLNSIL